MIRLVYPGVYLRRMTSGKHLVAVDPGDGATEYLEIPVAREPVDVGFSSRERHRPRDGQDFAFGEKVNIAIEAVE